jgi:2-polyprenyl-3-methyl-5-hydroxy-6-metoxy-1,4-benzoquinol methylase
MTGLALTNFLWPNHIAMRKFFRNKLPRDISGSYLEIGPGHGFYMMMAMRDTSYSHFLGIDISPASVDLTNRILCDSTFGCFDRYEIVERDFLKWSTNQRFDAVVMGEVLEHVENPIDFLRRINEFANEKGFIYITTAINAPAVDHIYLYRSQDEVEEQIVSAGLRIKERLLSPYLGTTLEESKENNLPINIALILEKNN